MGREIRVPEAPLRIVSLAPGATEMLFAAGAGGQVIATVEYSDEPAAARRVPRIGDVAAVDMERLVALQEDAYADDAKLAVGLPVAVAFERVDDSLSIPVFKPAQ